MSERTWSDQPKVLSSCDVLSSFYVRDVGQVEVRRRYVGYDGPAQYYVTVGNLFKSETVKCDDTDDVFAILNIIGKKKTGNILPAGCELVANG